VISIAKSRWLIISLTFCCSLAFTLPVAAAATVEAITVNITADTTPPPPRAAQRMAASVTTVSEHVLLGRAVSEVTAQRAGYEDLIREILDRVFVGYAVRAVNITAGPVTHIDVAIRPWGDVIREVKLEVDFGALSPALINLLQQDLGDIENEVSEVLIGLPIEAVDWAGGVSKAIIRELLAVKLPEFRATLDIIPGSETTVKLALTPVGPAVQDVSVFISSQTLPNILLLEARPALVEEARTLRGLPVDFVRRHQDYFEERLLAVMANQPLTGRYRLQLDSAITPGLVTKVLVTAETDKYSVWLEGYVDLGRRQDTVSGKLHAGKVLSERDELFMEITFMPSTISFDFIPGWGHRFSSKTVAGLKYNLNEKEESVFWEQQLGPNTSLRYERIDGGNRYEWGLRQRLHEFFSVEYYLTEDDKYLRLIGHL